MQQYKQTSLIYTALFIGQLLFAVVVVWMITGKTANTTEGYRSYAFEQLPLIIALTGLTGALLMNRLRTTQGAGLENIGRVLQHYHTTVILRSAILEGCNLIVLTLALLHGNLLYLIYFGLGMAGFLYFRPSPEGLAKEYGLTRQQEEELKRMAGAK
jgi:hypothetical protein